MSPTDPSFATLIGSDLRLPNNISEEVKTLPKGSAQLQSRSSNRPHYREVYCRDDASIQPAIRSELYLSQPGPSQCHYALPRPTFSGPTSLSQSFPSPPETLRSAHRPRERSRTMSQLVSVRDPKHNTRQAQGGGLQGGLQSKVELVPERSVNSMDFCSRVSAFKPIALKGGTIQSQQTEGAESSVWAGPPPVISQQELLPEQSNISECRYDALSGVELLDLLSKISHPNCTISKLE